MTSEEFVEKYRDKNKNYNSDHAIATLISLVAELNARNKILFKALEENEIEMEMSDESFTELRNDEMDKILLQIFE